MKRMTTFGLSAALLVAALAGCTQTTENSIDNNTSENPGVVSEAVSSTDENSDSYAETQSTNDYSASESTSVEIPETNTQSAYRVSVPSEITEIPERYFSPPPLKDHWSIYTTTPMSPSPTRKKLSRSKSTLLCICQADMMKARNTTSFILCGGWGNENQTLGTPDNPSGFKNVIDNAIANGDFEPIIIVCPTYNNTSPEDSANFSLALRLNQNFHNELINDLIPAVESQYSTYAESTSTEDLTASRPHRGFGGFSMGSVATWRTFQNCPIISVILCR